LPGLQVPSDRQQPVAHRHGCPPSARPASTTGAAAQTRARQTWPDPQVSQRPPTPPQARPDAPG
jgi:hypothetical protein